MINEEQRNIYTGLLGTLSFHLLLVIIFLSVKLGKVKNEHQELLLIEFSEQDFKTIEQIIEESKIKPEPIEELSTKTLSNIVSNTAEELDKQISTEEYEKEVMKELGMEEINPKYDNTLPDEVYTSENKRENETVKNFNYGETRIMINVPGRTGTYIERPIYRCQGGGTIIISIAVSQNGLVVEAKLKSSSTSDDCVQKMALESALNSSFNTDYNAAKKVFGTIKYVFVPQ